MTWHEATLAGLFDALQLPVVGPFAVQPDLELPPNRQVFYFLGGIEDQARALVDFAAQELGADLGRLVIVRPETPAIGSTRQEATDAWVRTAVDQARLDRWAEVLTLTPNELPGPLAAGGSSRDALLVLTGGAALSRLLDRADRAGWHPSVLIPGVFAGAHVLAAPKGFDGRLILAFPVLPSDAQPARLEEIWQLAERHGLAQRHLAAQLSALAAAEVLVEGLSRAGRDLSREGLIEALEGLYEYDTRLLPPVTFNPNRRLGARGAHIVKANLESGDFEPTGKRVVPR